MSFCNLMKCGIFLLALILLAGCQGDSPLLTPQSTVATLDRAWATRGETVTVSLTGANSSGAKVVVAGSDAAVTIINANKFSFVVPDAVPAGSQPVEIHLKAQTLLNSLNILGSDTVPGEFVLVVAPGTTVDALRSLLDPLTFVVLEGPRSLGAMEGTCSGELIRIKVEGVDTGDALDDIKAKEGEGTIWHSDPQSGYSSGTIDHLGAIGATGAHLRNLTGAGTVISVLDTGVSDHTELSSRLLTAEGYDFIDEGTPPVDVFGVYGHGTPIAVLAAGSVSGVAPQAQVLPVRVCDGNGTCYTSDVTLGLCYTLITTERKLSGMRNLILNLSFGGETPNEAIKAILDYALVNGTLVAAAGGNQGLQGSPKHYPAAYNMDGVVAVAALEADIIDELQTKWKPASFSTRGDYLDIAAPGVDLTSGTSSGGYHSSYSGTSYATALVSGALALWREANPSMSPANVEAGLEGAARKLSYSASEVGAGMLDLSTSP